MRGEPHCRRWQGGRWPGKRRGVARLSPTALGPEWRPSRFFDAWKDSVDAIKGRLVLQFMHYYRGMPPDAKKRAVDYILRGTMPDVYTSPDRKEALDAMNNDIDAMREYAARFLDRFWKDHWAEFLAKHSHDVD